MDLHPSAELLIRSVTLHLYTFWIQDSVQISSARTSLLLSVVEIQQITT